MLPAEYHADVGVRIPATLWDERNEPEVVGMASYLTTEPPTSLSVGALHMLSLGLEDPLAL